MATTQTQLGTSGIRTTYNGTQSSAGSPLKNRIINGNMMSDIKARTYRKWDGPYSGTGWRFYNSVNNSSYGSCGSIPILDKWYVERNGSVSSFVRQVLNYNLNIYNKDQFGGLSVYAGTANTPYMMEGWNSSGSSGSTWSGIFVYQVIESIYTKDLSNNPITLSWLYQANNALTGSYAVSVWKLNSKDTLTRKQTTGNYPGFNTVLNECTLIATLTNDPGNRPFDSATYIGGIAYTNQRSSWLIPGNIVGDVSNGMIVAFHPWQGPLITDTGTTLLTGSRANKFPWGAINYTGTWGTSPAFRLGQVQLEKGSVMTDFDYRPKSVENELISRYIIGFDLNDYNPPVEASDNYSMKMTVNHPYASNLRVKDNPKFINTGWLQNGSFDDSATYMAIQVQAGNNYTPVDPYASNSYYQFVTTHYDTVNSYYTWQGVRGLIGGLTGGTNLVGYFNQDTMFANSSYSANTGRYNLFLNDGSGSTGRITILRNSAIVANTNQTYFTQRNGYNVLFSMSGNPVTSTGLHWFTDI